MIVGIPRETFPGERRVAITPVVLPSLTKAGLEVLVESGAGVEAGFPDDQYTDKGARISSDRAQVFSDSDIILQVRTLGANPDLGRRDLELFRDGQTLIGLSEPLTSLGEAGELAGRGVSLFSMELMPRITRAQSMDVLSSMATIAGYKSVILAADNAPRMFPMLMTAAGTSAPAHLFVVGVGVAGLQAIATAKRLGAVVSAYDIRPAVKDQVKSVGGKFIEFELDTGESETEGGYAREMNEEFYRKQREMMLEVVAENNIVITTAAIPGKKAPILVTAEMVRRMAPGSLIVDLAAERGGNCELTKPGENVVEGGVLILGPLNLPSTVPFEASQMYGRNITAFLSHLLEEGKLVFDVEDEITKETLVTRGGAVVNPRILELIGSGEKASEGGTS